MNTSSDSNCPITIYRSFSYLEKLLRYVLSGGIFLGILLGLNGLPKALAETYQLRTELDGQDFTGMDGTDWSLENSQYENGVKLNGNDIGLDNPTAEYTLILPPFNANDNVILRVRFEGEGGERPVVTIANTEFNFVGDREGLYSWAITPPINFVDQSGGTTILKIMIRSANFSYYDLKHVGVDFDIETQNKWLDHYVVCHSTAKALREFIPALESFAVGKLLNQQTALAIHHLVGFAKNLSGVDDTGIVPLTSLSGAIDSLYNVLDAFTCGLSIGLSNFDNYSGDRPEAIANRIQDIANSLENFGNDWITEGNDGSITDQRTQLLGTLNQIIQELDLLIGRLSQHGEVTNKKGFAYSMVQIYHCRDLVGRPPDDCARNYAKGALTSLESLLSIGPVENKSCLSGAIPIAEDSILIGMKNLIQAFEQTIPGNPTPPTPTNTPRPTPTPGGDDNYEPNQNHTDAYDLRDHENVWLTEIDGWGIQTDDDWYRISVAQGDKVTIDCVFTNAEGDIDIELIDGGLETKAFSESTTSNQEHIEYITDAGPRFYIRVYGDNDDNVYDLRWYTVPPPTSTPTDTPRPTSTNTLWPTNTFTFTPTFTSTHTPTNEIVFTPTFTHSYTPTNTVTPRATSTPNETPFITPTFTPTFTPKPPIPTKTNTPGPTNTFTPRPTATHTRTPLIPDYNHDGRVSSADLLEMLKGLDTQDLKYDLNQDHKRDYKDLFLFSNWWLTEEISAGAKLE